MHGSSSVFTLCKTIIIDTVMDGLLMISVLEQRPANGRQMTRNVISLIIAVNRLTLVCTSGESESNLRMFQIHSYPRYKSQPYICITSV